MRSLPTVPEACSLSADALRDQVGRYRMIGEGARSKRRDALRLDVVVGRDVPKNVIDDLVRTEQACCPFFVCSGGRGSDD